MPGTLPPCSQNVVIKLLSGMVRIIMIVMRKRDLRTRKNCDHVRYPKLNAVKMENYILKVSKYSTSKLESRHNVLRDTGSQ